MRLPPPLHSSRVRTILILAASLALTTGCSLQHSSTPPPIAPSPTASVATPQPTHVTPKVILVAPDLADAALADQAGTTLRDLAASSGMEFLRQTSLPGGDSSAITLLVAVPPDLGLLSWAEAHPQVQTAALGIPGLQSAPNLSRIASDGIRNDQLGFALGYLAAMVTSDYRIGALVRDSTPAALSLARGFVAGGTYYCGLCRPTHPPYVAYPVLFKEPDADLAGAGLTTLLVAPPPASLADVGLTTSAGMALLGLGEPPVDLASVWIASADFDVDGAIRALWSQVETGEGGGTYPLSIRFRAVDAARVSEGRLRRAEALLEDLAAGRIDTGIDPQTGELR